jgi:hypothetical protein
MNEMPQVETYFLSSGSRYSQEWGGVGELVSCSAIID